VKEVEENREREFPAGGEKGKKGHIFQVSESGIFGDSYVLKCPLGTEST
jgi:hypothetical protein